MNRRTLKPSSIARHFLKFMPRESVIDQPALLRVYECDGLSAYRQTPLLAVLPDSIEQVQRALAVCAKLHLPVVSRGAGTGLSGGATPCEGGVVLCLAKMNAILQIDPRNRRARVQPGVRNRVISEAAQPHGLFYAPDPSSQIACTIGGNVAENAGGVHCLKYGLTVHNIESLTVATIDGALIELTTAESGGFDLLALLIGSEGMLGVVVEACVKLLPLPQAARVALAAFDDPSDAADAVAAIIAAGVIPAGIEMMDNPAIRAAEEFAHAGYPRDAAAILLCELDGFETEVDAQLAFVQSLLRQHGAREIKIARDESEAARFWSGRKSAFPAIGRISPDYYCIDGTIPRRQVGNVLAQINHLSREYGLRVANVFHAGDGNLHPLILYDANQPGALEKTEQLGMRILQLCIDVGGTITGEHGVGLEKLGGMCAQFSDAERAQFHALRTAFDPHHLLNPGKAIPTLARCAEHNAMHVHSNTPHRFANIERF